MSETSTTATLQDVAWPIHAERLTLRPAVKSDLDATWRIRRLDAVNKWITAAPTDRESYRAHFEDPERLARTLVIELDGVVIGDLMLLIGDAWAQSEVADQARGVQAELGWCLDPDQAGRGYATEAVAALIRLCFEDLGLRRVTASCFADNVASWRLMDRLGMRRESHTIRDSLHRSGEWLDGLEYGLLADEWRAQAGADNAQASALIR
jgi:RimJ/RimL family protein N-acetyltransferase